MLLSTTANTLLTSPDLWDEKLMIHVPLYTGTPSIADTFLCSLLTASTSPPIKSFFTHTMIYLTHIQRFEVSNVCMLWQCDGGQQQSK